MQNFVAITIKAKRNFHRGHKLHFCSAYILLYILWHAKRFSMRVKENSMGLFEYAELGASPPDGDEQQRFYCWLIRRIIYFV